jgi:hypothetical protein
MTINDHPFTPARWRRLHPELRQDLRRVLGRTSAILGRLEPQVLGYVRHGDVPRES